MMIIIGGGDDDVWIEGGVAPLETPTREHAPLTHRSEQSSSLQAPSLGRGSMIICLSAIAKPQLDAQRGIKPISLACKAWGQGV